MSWRGSGGMGRRAVGFSAERWAVKMLGLGGEAEGLGEGANVEAGESAADVEVEGLEFDAEGVGGLLAGDSWAFEGGEYLLLPSGEGELGAVAEWDAGHGVKGG